MPEQAEVSLRLQAAVLETIAHGDGIQKTLSQLCDLVEDVIQDGICSVMLLDDSSGALNVAAAPRASRKLIKALNGLIPSDMAGSCGTAVFQQQPVFVRDTLQDPRWAPLRSVVTEFNIAACWSVPIRSSDDTPVGSFAISHLKICEPTSVEEQILLTASHIAGIAIEHHHMIHALQASDEKFRDLYDSAPDMFASVDATNAIILDCNLALAENLGLPKEEIIGKTIFSIYHPDYHEDVERCFQSFRESGEVRGKEFQLLSKSGRSIDVSISVSAIRDDKGRIIRSRSILRDITKRKQVEREIQRRAENQALLVELSTELIRTRPEMISGKLNQFLEKTGSRYDLDSIGMWWFAEDRTTLHCTHRWERVPGQTLPTQRSVDDYPWYMECLRTGQPLVVNDVDDMPPGAALEQAALRHFGSKSALAIPFLVDERLEGVSFFALRREKRPWSDQNIAELKLISQNLANAYARCQATEEIEQLKNELLAENIYLREEVRAAHGFDEIIGEDTELRRCLQAVEKVAPTEVTVLILGETGTGKELIARALHNLSDRRDGPMVSVNCPALPAELIESELFGHEKGAFTGAQSQRKGRFEVASGGTLFLDELGELPVKLQSKLLRVLQTGEFERLGGTETLHANVRLIAATNRNLVEAVDNSEFRADLYYRISTFPIQLPALRDRRDDIPMLAEHFVRKHAERLNKEVTAISSSMLKELEEYSWPGNIRELESIIERALISSTSPAVLKLSGPLNLAVGSSASSPGSPPGQRIDLAAVNRSHILKVLEQTDWMISGSRGAASVLGMPPSTLRSKMKRLKISRQTA